jgi:hypothetical protein
MIRSLDFYRGIVMGLGLMYAMDRDPGRNRLARLLGARVLSDAADTLADRVRAKLGGYVSHPEAIVVESHGGCVSLHGTILRSEVEELINAVSSVRGVSEVVNRLSPHGTPAHLRHLPDVAHDERRPPWTALGIAAWTPGLRLAAGIAGAAALAVGIARVTARVRSNRRDEMENEMPEYAMLR